MSETVDYADIGLEAVDAEQIARVHAAATRHGLMELELNLDGTMETVAADPDYEIVSLGWRLKGRKRFVRCIAVCMPVLNCS